MPGAIVGFCVLRLSIRVLAAGAGFNLERPGSSTVFSGRFRQKALKLVNAIGAQGNCLTF